MNSVYMERILFLFIGGINTIAGYFIGVIALMLLMDKMPLFFIGLVASIVAIAFSYTTQKVFVFKTKDFALDEIKRAFITYGTIAVISGMMTELVISYLTKDILCAQLIVMVFGTIISYMGLKYYVFKK